MATRAWHPRRLAQVAAEQRSLGKVKLIQTVFSDLTALFFGIVVCRTPHLGLSVVQMRRRLKPKPMTICSAQEVCELLIEHDWPHHLKSEIIEKCKRSLLLWKETKDYSEDYEKDVAATGEKNYQIIAQALGMNLELMPRRHGGVGVRF
jgi:hypothetical protein